MTVQVRAQVELPAGSRCRRVPASVGARHLKVRRHLHLLALRCRGTQTEIDARCAERATHPPARALATPPAPRTDPASSRLLAPPTRPLCPRLCSSSSLPIDLDQARGWRLEAARRADGDAVGCPRCRCRRCATPMLPSPLPPFATAVLAAAVRVVTAVLVAVIARRPRYSSLPSKRPVCGVCGSSCSVECRVSVCCQCGPRPAAAGSSLPPTLVSFITGRAVMLMDNNVNECVESRFRPPHGHKPHARGVTDVGTLI